MIEALVCEHSQLFSRATIRFTEFTPEALRARIKKETATWAAIIIKDVGIRVQ